MHVPWVHAPTRRDAKPCKLLRGPSPLVRLGVREYTSQDPVRPLARYGESSATLSSRMPTDPMETHLAWLLKWPGVRLRTLSLGPGFLALVPALSWMLARPLAVTSASAGAAATLSGAGGAAPARVARVRVRVWAAGAALSSEAPPGKRQAREAARAFTLVAAGRVRVPRVDPQVNMAGVSATLRLVRIATTLTGHRAASRAHDMSIGVQPRTLL